MLPLSDDNVEQTSGYGLRIRMVGMRDLGAYMCQAYNGLGHAASTTMIVQALGPIGKEFVDASKARVYFAAGRK